MVDLACFELQEVLAPLFASLERLQAASNTEVQLQSQLILVRIISQCLDRHQANLHINEKQSFADRLALKALTCASSLLNLCTISALPTLSKEKIFVKGSRPAASLLENRATTVCDTVIPEELRQHAQLIVKHISRLAWPIAFNYFDKIIANVDETEDDYNQQLSYLCWLHLDVPRLEQLLGLLVRVLPTMKKTSQLVLAGALDCAILAWLEKHPTQFHQSVQDSRKFAHAGQTIFEILQDLAQEPKRRRLLWPMLATLVMCFPDSVHDSKRNSKKQFLDYIIRPKPGKDTVAVLEAQTRMLYFASLVSSQGNMYMVATVTEIASNVRATIDEVRVLVEQGIFSAVQLLIALSALQFDELVYSILSSWLEKDGINPANIQVINVITQLNLHPQTNRYVSCIESFSGLAPMICGKLVDFMERCTGPAPVLIVRPQDFPLDLEMGHALLKLLCLDPKLVFSEAIFKRIPALTTSLLYSIASDKPESKALGGRLAMEYHKAACLDGMLFDRRIHNMSPAEYMPIWCAISHDILQGLATHLSTSALESEQIKFRLGVLTDCLRERSKSLAERSALAKLICAAQGQSSLRDAIEKSLLILTCHADPLVAASAAKACVLLLEEIDIQREYGCSTTYNKTPTNTELFRALAKEVFLTQGRNATQRKITKCLLDTACMTAGLAQAWTEIYGQWRESTQIILVSHVENASMVEDDVRRQWQNHTAFLCAAGRMERFTKAQVTALPFLECLVEALVAPDALLREACTVIISRDLHLSMCSALLVQMQSLISTMKDSNGVLIVRNRNSALAENLIIIMKGLFERLTTFLERSDGLDIGSIMLTLGRYMELSNSQSLRFRFCQLCDIVARQCDLLLLSSESDFKRSLCNILVRWIPEGPHASYQGRVSRDMVLPCLKAIAKLTENMFLKPDSHSSDIQVFASQESFLFFAKPYLMDWVGAEPESPQAANLALLTTSLRNVLCANQDHVFQSYLECCYHQSPAVQSVFLGILQAVVGDGGTSRLVAVPTAELHANLLEHFMRDPFCLPALLESCSSIVAFEQLASAFINLFEAHNTLQQHGSMLISSRALLFYLMINTEVGICDTEGELFRRNSSLSRVWNLYMRKFGDGYVKSTLLEPLQALAARDEDYSIEIDPERIIDQSQVLQNLQHMSETCASFVEAICSSGPQLPP